MESVKFAYNNNAVINTLKLSDMNDMYKFITKALDVYHTKEELRNDKIKELFKK